MNKKKELCEAENERRGLMQMYQAGFYDGYNYDLIRPKKFSFLKKMCLKAFEFRFVKKISKFMKVDKK